MSQIKPVMEPIATQSALLVMTSGARESHETIRKLGHSIIEAVPDGGTSLNEAGMAMAMCLGSVGDMSKEGHPIRLLLGDQISDAQIAAHQTCCFLMAANGHSEETTKAMVWAMSKIVEALKPQLFTEDELEYEGKESQEDPDSGGGATDQSEGAQSFPA